MWPAGPRPNFSTLKPEMPIQLNLLHEVERARAASRRDPLKISLYILAVIIAGFAGLYFWELGKAHMIDGDLARRKADFEAIEPEAKAAAEREESLQKVFARKDALVSKIEGRFFWAPVLAEIGRQVPREVQLTKLTGNVSGEGVMKIEMGMDGVSCGDDPRKVAEELRQSIGEALGRSHKNVESRFRSLEDGVEAIPLDGRPRPSANFAITVTFQIGEAPPATPEPRKKKKA